MRIGITVYTRKYVNVYILESTFVFVYFFVLDLSHFLKSIDLSHFLKSKGGKKNGDLHLTGNASALLTPCPSMLVARQV